MSVSSFECFFFLAEEILDTNSAMWFSKDSSYLLFASFNDTRVGELKYPWYGKLGTRKIYPEIKTLRYPKVRVIYNQYCLSVKNCGICSLIYFYFSVSLMLVSPGFQLKNS